MSKSLGNFKTVRDVAEQYGYEPIRYLMISSHYRKPINYNLEIVEQCIASLERLYNCKENLTFALKNAPEGEADKAFIEKLNARKEQFDNAMDDDLNTADALAAIFELVRDINVSVISAGTSKGSCEAAYKLFTELCDVLGILYKKDEDSLDDKVEELIKLRTEARAQKNWAEADRIRDELKAMGIILKDTPQGVTWSKE